MDNIDLLTYALFAYFFYKVIFKLGVVFYPYVICKMFGIRKFERWIVPGEWAVITGATDGIGKAYAEEFARRGMNIFLISRTQLKLDYVARNIELTYGVSVKTYQLDFTNATVIDYDKIADRIVNLNIGILVNNVGVMPKAAMKFENVKRQFIWDSINVNCQSYALMTSVVLPHFTRKDRGLVLSLSSILGIWPAANLTTYASTKRFETHLNDCLTGEYPGGNIIFQTIRPGTVCTKSGPWKSHRPWTVSPEELVRDSLYAVGTFVNPSEGMVYFALQNAIIQAICPRSLWVRASGPIFALLDRFKDDPLPEPAHANGHTPMQTNEHMSPQSNGHSHSEDSNGHVPMEQNGHIPTKSNGHTSSQVNGHIPMESNAQCNGHTPIQSNGNIPAETIGHMPMKRNGHSPMQCNGHTHKEPHETGI